ncbi:hypothetical protein [Paenibacillus hamazuiensis]|uniref:hypothetical protein n=1 Tax=Paenibacillus hamazuiensis TaxID=2936508 RepID=UPI00200F2B46|nr:hypothetical protein [Paenibacillus hamazuiensis]
MTKNKSNVDKNLQNVVEDLDKTVVGGHHAQQVNQQSNDRRHQDALNHQSINTNTINALSDKDV